MEKRRKPQEMITTTVQVSPHFYRLCQEHNIKFVEAMRIGIAVALAEKDVIPYDNKLNLYRKMRLYQQELEKLLQKAKGEQNEGQQNPSEPQSQ